MSEMTASYLLVASSDTNLCNFVGKWMEMHRGQTDGTNFLAFGHLEHFQQRLAGGSLLQRTGRHFALKSGLQLIAVVAFNEGL